MVQFRSSGTNRQWIVSDNSRGWNGFNVTNTTTGGSYNIQFAWVGSNPTKTSTSEFADCGEFYETEPRKFAEFRNRLHTDDEFVETQVIMNNRLNIWQTMRTAGTAEYRNHAQAVTYNTTGSTNDIWTFTTDISRFNQLASWYTKHRKLDRLAVKIANVKYMLSEKLQFNLSAEEVAYKQATKKGNKLLKEWLSKDEYKALMNNELRIAAENEEIVIRKNPSACVEVVDSKEVTHYCIIPKEYKTVDGDALLAKIMLAKTNPQLLKEIAIKRFSKPLVVAQ